MNLLIITGASSGIGRAIAQRFRRDGFAVVNISRQPCPEQGVTNIPCDLAEPGAADGLGRSLSPWLWDGSRVCVVHSASVMHLTTSRSFSALSIPTRASRTMM